MCFCTPFRSLSLISGPCPVILRASACVPMTSFRLRCSIQIMVIVCLGITTLKKTSDHSLSTNWDIDNTTCALSTAFCWQHGGLQDNSRQYCHSYFFIFNLSLLESVCPQAWREAKVIPLPKNSKDPFTGSNSQTISLLPTLSKLLRNIVFDQIQCYFTVNKLTTDFQHAYKEEHSSL